MPELPDIAAYVEALRARLVGQALVRVHVSSPFVVRTVTPPLSALVFTEAGSRKRASLNVVEGESNLKLFNRGGLEVIGSRLDAFAQVLTRENHTLKRALTDPRILSGIGNAYSDEILEARRLPLASAEPKDRL